ncbi:phosphate acyltransferase [Vibrio chaetopteri]|uniref:phosphate acyltransferase n=1 Tax=Vibrio chaetopteri TaxID=3016528 RepID=UPI003AB6E0E0
MNNVNRFLNQVREQQHRAKRIVVAAAHDKATILAVDLARVELDVEITLVGEFDKITQAVELAGASLASFEVVIAEGDDAIAEMSVRLIADGKGHILMKGLIETSTLLIQLLKREFGLRTDSLLSHTALLMSEGSEKYYLLTDAGMNISPSLEQKEKIINNAVTMAHALGNSHPNVAMLCAKEKSYDKMPATLDATELQRLNQIGQIKGCTVSGPIQLDLALSKQAAEMKGCTDPVAGNADIFIAPSIEVGNVFGKALKYMGDYIYAGVVLGAKVPVVVVSRADSEQEKLLSIAMACMCNVDAQEKVSSDKAELENA